MSVSDLSLVNQRLSYARILLQDIKELTVHDSFKADALLDACIFHLNCALAHYLREVSARYQMPVLTGTITLASLGKALGARNLVSSEFDELAQLDKSSGSWLNNLQAAYRRCWVQVVDSAPPENAIAVVNLDAVETSKPSLEKLLAWHEAMAELIVRQRESAVEC